MTEDRELIDIIMAVWQLSKATNVEPMRLIDSLTYVAWSADIGDRLRVYFDD